MKDENFESLMAGMSDVLGFYRGKRAGFAIHSPTDIKAIRGRTKLSQPRFAERYHLDVAALRDWEQGRRQPDRAAQVLFELIAREPETIGRILSGE